MGFAGVSVRALLLQPEVAGFVIVRSDLGYCYASVCMDGSWVVRGGLNCGW